MKCIFHCVWEPRCRAIRVSNLIRGLKVRELEEVFTSQASNSGLSCHTLVMKILIVEGLEVSACFQLIAIYYSIHWHTMCTNVSCPPQRWDLSKRSSFRRALPRSPLVRQSTRLRLCRNAMAVCWTAAENAMYVALLALPSLNIIDAVWLCLIVSWCFMWFSFQFPTGGRFCPAIFQRILSCVSPRKLLREMREQERGAWH